MEKVDKLMLHDIANKLMFDMEDEQYNTLMEEFSVVLKQMELISEIPGVDEAEPMTFPYQIKSTYLREDMATKPLKKEEALKNANDVINGQIRLPKVVG